MPLGNRLTGSSRPLLDHLEERVGEGAACQQCKAEMNLGRPWKHLLYFTSWQRQYVGIILLLRNLCHCFNTACEHVRKVLNMLLKQRWPQGRTAHVANESKVARLFQDTCGAATVH